ncbi:uncharacterized protein DFL_008391 [Arthrobotrys flagrans]|uniref:Opi1-domain-containing protein n=1 Tax=Arthrobotrys flagrans TaxID=97331 RepID=A0A436ZNM1_ARTFL|nr:hypothetical protein DFL_008391 [Arthrobotrys flagrans]
MATRLRSQSTTPKPPSPDKASPLSSTTSPQTSNSSSLASSTVVFNTTMLASAPTAVRGPLPAILPHEPSPDVAQAQTQQIQAQDPSHASPVAASAAPTYSSVPPPAVVDYYSHHSAISNNSGIPISTARSMSIQSLVSTNSSATITDDDASSIISHTTTRNTEDSASVDGDLSVDIDDPDVRMAAEALGDLRADFVSSPKSVPNSPPQKNEKREERKESMMEMIQGQNTFLGTAVRAGRSVYKGGKRYSPRFKYGAEIVERAAAPMTSVVSYAARTTGVESVLRRNLEARRLSSSGTSSQSSPSHSQPSSLTGSHVTKRRKTAFEEGHNGSGGAMEVDSTSSSTGERDGRDNELTHKPATDVVSLNWQRRLMLSTAGVGVALSEESLKSLKYCLAWLRWANDHLDKVIMALRGVIREYDSDKSRANGTSGKDGGTDEGDDERSAQLQNKIETLRKDVIGTLKRVVDVVSTYAGGALPENARVVVKACITNLPRRWALAAKDDNAGANASGNNMAVVVRREEAGKRVLVLAREGLEMLHQVSAIVQLTLERAEEWCERLGRKRPEEGDYGKVGWDVDMELDGVGEEARKDR